MFNIYKDAQAYKHFFVMFSTTVVSLELIVAQFSLDSWVAPSTNLHPRRKQIQKALSFLLKIDAFTKLHSDEEAKIPQSTKIDPSNLNESTVLEQNNRKRFLLLVVLHVSICISVQRLFSSLLFFPELLCHFNQCLSWH